MCVVLHTKQTLFYLIKDQLGVSSKPRTIAFSVSIYTNTHNKNTAIICRCCSCGCGWGWGYTSHTNINTLLYIIQMCKIDLDFIHDDLKKLYCYYIHFHKTYVYNVVHTLFNTHIIKMSLFK